MFSIAVVKEIRFVASFGMDKKTVVLTPVNGAGGCWHLYVDNFYWGQFNRHRNGHWMAQLQRPPGWLTGADIEVLCDLLAAQQSNA